jgi:hypothetical protein
LEQRLCPRMLSRNLRKEGQCRKLFLDERLDLDSKSTNSDNDTTSIQ